MKQTSILPATPANIQAAARTIRDGGLVAFPTETVYGLGADATSATAVAGIFEAKARPLTDPVIVHIAETAELESVAVDLPPLAHDLAAAFMPGALTLVLKRSSRIPALVSAERMTVAVRLPSHPVAHALIQAAGVPIAAPSANTFSRPSATTAAHVLEDLNGKIDLILDGGAATIGVESTILDLTAEPPVILRPGGVPVEALRRFIPDLQIAERYLSRETAAPAPGQMLKHYSPRAEVFLYTGNSDAKVKLRMREDVRAYSASGKSAGLLITDDAPPTGMLVETAALGTDLATISARLYAALRELDARGVDGIFVRWTRRDGLGAAVWDRLVRAAEGRVIIC